MTLLIAVLFFGDVLEDKAARADYALRELNCRLQREWWLHCGVMDEDEVKSIFAYPSSYEEDLDRMLWRWREITPDTPPTSDKYRMPNPTHSRWGWNVSKDFLKWLELYRQYLGPVEQRVVDEHIAYQKWRIEVWTLIDDIAWPANTKLGKRLMLQRLRELIGDVDYYSNNWPDPIPDYAANFDWRKLCELHR